MATPQWLMCPALLLLAARLIPSIVANSRPAVTARLVARLTGINCLAATLRVALQLTGQADFLPSAPESISVTEVLLIDGISVLMLLLVSTVGWVISRYSVRYLAGETRQGSYSLWLSLTIGAVSFLAVSGNLLLMFIAWGLASLGIHQLLTHYKDRPAASHAAWMKFGISRGADVALVGAGFLIYREFGTLELTQLFAAVNDYGITGLPANSLMPTIGALLIAGAALKTAQFPFHSWLPETLEAPTPVSALMHAGIINAGGYLLVRLSPLLAWSHTSLTALACLGAFTACFAALVMLTQTSIKKSLAWSTIAQMGFMMFQCGLGAFSAAMLHIIAHSLYKAHAFLNSGDVLTEKAATRGSSFSLSTRSSAGFATLTAATIGTVAIYVGVAEIYGLRFSEKPGGFLLCLILCLGLARWLWLNLRARNRFSLAIGVGTAAILSAIYIGVFQAIDAIVGSGPILASAARNVPAIAAIAASGFVSLSLFETWLWLRSSDDSHRPAPWLQAAYVHASNGFYVDAALSRLTRLD